jgi:GTP cyclohydrolase IA
MTKKILANENKPIPDKKREEICEKLQYKFTEILDILGFDRLRDPNLQDTPSRLAKMYTYEILDGNFSAPPKMTVFPNTKNYDQIVALSNIEVKSLCSHHFCPFLGKCSIGYQPDKHVIGLSKLSRIVTHFARRPQIQEELTEQIADYLVEILKPKGVIVVMHCEHHCMKVRGVEEHDSEMHTSAVRGTFLTNPSTKQEFFELIRKQN